MYHSKRVEDKMMKLTTISCFAAFVLAASAAALRAISA